MPATTTSDDPVVFVSAALEEDRFFLVSMHGREAISQLFELQVVLQTARPLTADDVDKMLIKAAYVAVAEEGEHKWKLHAAVRAVEALPQPWTRSVAYVLTLVPRLWFLTQTTRSRVFLDKSVPDIVKAVLLEAGLAQGTDFEVKLSGRHPVREFTVQYEETDFAFISRLMEHEGMFYAFVHGEDCEKMVVGDSNNALAPLAGYETISYQATSGVTDPGRSVLEVQKKVQVVPRRAFVRDYANPKPAAVIASERAAPIDEKGWPVDRAGHGLQVFYGEHAGDNGEANRLAQLRAEEHLARKVQFTGRSDVRGLHAGHVFALEGHFLDELNAEYVVTELEHAVEQQGASPEGEGGRKGYFNDFVAIPKGVTYRPPRLTALPRIHGVVHAHIDGTGAGTEAPIDEDGRYRVVMPYDTVAVPNEGKATLPIRMMQPYAGPGYGMHLPLHEGAEVLVVHIGGDPDRPVIAGGVPNPLMANPMVKPLGVRSVIRSRSDIRIEFDDDA